MTEITVNAVLPVGSSDKFDPAECGNNAITDLYRDWTIPITFSVDGDRIVQIMPPVQESVTGMPEKTVVMSGQNEIHDTITKKMSAKGETYWDTKVSFDSDADVEAAIQRLKEINTRMREEFL